MYVQELETGNLTSAQSVLSFINSKEFKQKAAAFSQKKHK
jgi:hypothetical protein